MPYCNDAKMRGGSKETLDKMPMPTDSRAFGEFISISDAVSRLVRGMWGGLLRRPLLVVKIMHKTKSRSSMGYGPRREEARQLITTAARQGDLRVYVIAEPYSQAGTRDSQDDTRDPQNDIRDHQDDIRDEQDDIRDD